MLPTSSRPARRNGGQGHAGHRRPDPRAGRGRCSSAITSRSRRDRHAKVVQQSRHGPALGGADKIHTNQRVMMAAPSSRTSSRQGGRDGGPSCLCFFVYLPAYAKSSCSRASASTSCAAATRPSPAQRAGRRPSPSRSSASHSRCCTPPGCRTRRPTRRSQGPRSCAAPLPWTEAGQVTHLTPKDVCTDSDNYAIDFAPGASEVDKANMIASSILLDYMFFERDERCDAQEVLLPHPP